MPDRPIWGRIAAVILVLALACRAPAPAIAQEACGNYAVATAPQPPGHPLSDNVVTLTTPNGELSNGAFAEPRTVEPSPKPGVALVRSLGGIFGLMDVITGEIIPLEIPESDQSRLTTTYPTIRNAPEANFMLLASGPDSVWLVDLTNGDALNLTTLDGDGLGFIDSASISPNGKWAIYSFQDTAFLLSLETPGNPEPLDSDPILPFPSFDANNNVVYAAGAENAAKVRALDPSTGERREVADAPNIRVLPLQLSDPLLLIDGLTLLVLADGETTPKDLFAWTSGPSAVLMNEAGSQVLLSDKEKDVTAWYWVDVATGASVEVAELAEMTPIVTTSRRDSVTFAPTVRIGPGLPGAQYRTFDLNTGTVSMAMEQDSDDVYQAKPAGDSDGRYTIVNAVSPGSGRVWLIDSQTGSATQIATSPGNADARVSPDGCQLAVAIYNTVGEGRTSTVTVTSLIDGSTVMTVPDALLLGWANVTANAAPEDG